LKITGKFEDNREIWKIQTKTAISGLITILNPLLTELVNWKVRANILN